MLEKKDSLVVSAARKISEIEQDPEFKKAFKHFYIKVKEFNDKYLGKDLKVAYGQIQDYFAGYIMHNSSFDHDAKYFFEKVRDMGDFNDSIIDLVNEYCWLKQDIRDIFISPDDPLLK